MIKVNVVKESNYPVGTPVLKKRLKNFLTKAGIVSDCEVSVALVGEKKMLKLGEGYLADKKLHNVLSFPEPKGEKNFRYPPEGKIYLGEIIVCYPEARAEAISEGKLIDEKIYELVEHGARHLLGFHHD